MEKTTSKMWEKREGPKKIQSRGRNRTTADQQISSSAAPSWISTLRRWRLSKKRFRKTQGVKEDEH